MRLYERFGDATAIDLPDSGLRAEWKTRPGPRYLHADAEKLPFRDDEFDLTVCVEVLEHLVDPRAGAARAGPGDLRAPARLGSPGADLPRLQPRSPGGT